MRCLINRWTAGGIVCMFGSDSERAFTKAWRASVKEYRPEIARIVFNKNTTIFSFPDVGSKDTFNKWERPEYIQKPESVVIYRKSTLKRFY